MNRADRMLAVLRDGREHSRQDIFDRAGFMLTNNAASELRAQGHNVIHSKRDGLDVYQLAPLSLFQLRDFIAEAKQVAA